MNKLTAVLIAGAFALGSVAAMAQEGKIPPQPADQDKLKAERAKTKADYAKMTPKEKAAFKKGIATQKMLDLQDLINQLRPPPIPPQEADHEKATSAYANMTLGEKAAFEEGVAHQKSLDTVQLETERAIQRHELAKMTPAEQAAYGEGMAHQTDMAAARQKGAQDELNAESAKAEADLSQMTLEEKAAFKKGVAAQTRLERDLYFYVDPPQPCLPAAGRPPCEGLQYPLGIKDRAPKSGRPPQ